eukprot:c14476_g1_i1.p1 GENE.c14476_g1_i1~~c14476_g1_i1.p1  ORF type:complete len:138 (-),score=19.81 c14476_g1_i1:33-446(-)
MLPLARVVRNTQPATLTFVRTAKAKAATPAKGAASGGGKKKESMVKVKDKRDTDVISALTLIKEGEWSKDWKLHPRQDYPSWLWTLADPEPTLSQLKDKITEIGDFGAVPHETLKRFIKISNRSRIKANNLTTAKNK